MEDRITRWCYFCDTSAIYIAVYRGCYFRLGVIFTRNAQSRKTQKLPPHENFHIYSSVFTCTYVVILPVLTIATYRNHFVLSLSVYMTCLSGSHTLLSKLLQTTYVFLEQSGIDFYIRFYSYIFEDERGVFPETEYIFDLLLPKEFTPVCTDGEVQSFQLVPISRVSGMVGIFYFCGAQFSWIHKMSKLVGM